MSLDYRQVAFNLKIFSNQFILQQQALLYAVEGKACMAHRFDDD